MFTYILLNLSESKIDPLNIKLNQTEDVLKENVSAVIKANLHKMISDTL